MIYLRDVWTAYKWLIVDPLPQDKKCHEDEDGNSVFSADWLEHTGEFHNMIDLSYGKMGQSIAYYSIKLK